MVKWISESKTLGADTGLPCKSIYDCPLGTDCINTTCVEVYPTVQPPAGVESTWWDRCIRTGGNSTTCLNQWNTLHPSFSIIPIYKICNTTAECPSGLSCINNMCTSNIGIPGTAPAPGSIQVLPPRTMITCDTNKDCPAGQECGTDRLCHTSPTPSVSTPTPVSTPIPTPATTPTRVNVSTASNTTPLIIGIAALAIVGIAIAAS